jgi:hypothetical protein
VTIERPDEDETPSEETESAFAEEPDADTESFRADADSSPGTESAPPPSSSAGVSEEEGRRARRRRIESMLRESFRRAIERGVEAGVETISRADSAIRNVVDDVKLPKEMVGYVFSQMDETKNALVRVVAGEVREFLDTTDIAGELQRALTSLTFEIKTEIRFIPNEAGVMKPKVKAKVAPKRRRPEDEEEKKPSDESE